MNPLSAGFAPETPFWIVGVVVPKSAFGPVNSTVSMEVRDALHPLGVALMNALATALASKPPIGKFIVILTSEASLRVAVPAAVAALNFIMSI